MKECDDSAQQDLCFQSPLIVKEYKNNTMMVMMAESRLITLLRLYLCFAIWENKTNVHGRKGIILCCGCKE